MEIAFWLQARVRLGALVLTSWCAAILLPTTSAAAVETPVAQVCTEGLVAQDTDIEGIVISADVQRVVAFGALFSALLASLIYSRLQVQELSRYLGNEAAPTKRGRPPGSASGLWKSLRRWGKQWWGQNEKPFTLIARAIVFGYVVPLVVFGLAAIYFSWLFPGTTLLARADQCSGKVANVISFMWSQFYGGASLGIPETLSSGPLQIASLARATEAILFVAAFRLFVMWAGSFSFVQMVGQLSFKRFENLLRGAWIRFSKYLRFSPTKAAPDRE